jgi:hypothetical protein
MVEATGDPAPHFDTANPRSWGPPKTKSIVSFVPMAFRCIRPVAIWVMV